MKVLARGIEREGAAVSGTTWNLADVDEGRDL